MTLVFQPLQLSSFNDLSVTSIANILGGFIGTKNKHCEKVWIQIEKGEKNIHGHEK